jgi:peroxiredoxin
MKLNGKLVAALIVAGGLFSGSAWAQDTKKPPADPNTKPVVEPADPKKSDKQPDKKDDKKSDWGTAKVGETAPAFTLTDTDGKTVNLSDFKDKVVVLQWYNSECPFVVKHYTDKSHQTFNDLHKDFSGKGVAFLAINSGAPGKQGAGKDISAKSKTDWKVPYPILIDESGKVGMSYNAKNTPLMLVVGKDGKIIYRGAIDNNKKFDDKEYKNYVRQALDQTIKGETVTEPETKPYGCSVKYAS